MAALFDRDKRATVPGYSVSNAAGRLNAKRRAAPGQPIAVASGPLTLQLYQQPVMMVCESKVTLRVQAHCTMRRGQFGSIQ